ncbi:transcriptional regulator, LysR family [Cohaesibacter sp. ES.047]|uniref:LysR family transcriptional regulator n=1 Tax=Cohaesibacter sp. ES.047 TaxID=1798205 RepID=UPI000BB6ED9D|nr:LysR family transcriptional regulator [Cohaesibacter sp. ES.047]SNY92256.1 transcriptional regulator, LysR family [Cohaesibacter sp. ES.047]
MRATGRTLLADLNVFVTIVRRQSMRQAAIELGVTTSALSHRLRKLETELGVKLLNRTSRSLKPTEAGAILASQLEVGLQTIDDALGTLSQYRDHPTGRLRLNALRDAATLILRPVMPRYFEQFPDMHIDLGVDDHLVDIVEEGFDAGIRYGDRVPQDMIGVALTGPQNWVVIGSPDLIARVGRPAQPQDLLEVPCIEMRVGDNSRYPWELGNGPSLIRIDVRGPFCSNATEQTIDAALEGIGFAYCLESRVRNEVATGRLELVMPDWASEGPPFTIYYPSRRQVPPGLHALIDLIREDHGLARLATRNNT